MGRHSKASRLWVDGMVLALEPGLVFSALVSSQVLVYALNQEDRLEETFAPAEGDSAVIDPE